MTKKADHQFLETWGHSYIESSHSLRQIDASGRVGLALWRSDLTHEKLKYDVF